jgi:hypothetical protein
LNEALKVQKLSLSIGMKEQKEIQKQGEEF